MAENNSEQEKILRLLRCDEIQGFLISRPLPESELVAFLRQALLRRAAKSMESTKITDGEAFALQII